MASEIIEIEVVNWEKYNPRSDRGGYSWFRMDNQFFLHMRQRKGYSADATILMSFLLAEASDNNGKPFKLRLGFAAEMIGRTVKQVENALDELVKNIDVRFTSGLKRLEAACTLTDGRTDERNLQDSSTEEIEDKLPEDSFERALAEYKKFPGVTKGSHAEARFADQIRHTETFQSLLEAIENYRTFLGRKENEWRSPKTSFENFLGTKRSGFFWREFIIAPADVSPAQAPLPLGTLSDLTGGQASA